MSVGGERAFDLTPGQRITRKELHQLWGGRQQGGISPSRSSKNIFIFWAPDVGPKHGYYDEFRSDGRFYYTGAGQFGDQQMRDANLALLNHAKDDRRVRLLEGAGGVVTYRGELEIDSDQPYYETEAPETGEGPLRRVFVFRFNQLSGDPIGPRSRLEPALDQMVAAVALERRWTEKYYVQPAGEEYEAERREQELVLRFEEYLRARGHDVARLKIVPPGERRPIFCDLFSSTANALVEAKGSVARESIRMAIGQLFDYQRFTDDAGMWVLVPERPRDDLRALLASAGVGAVWPTSGAFTDTGGGEW